MVWLCLTSRRIWDKVATTIVHFYSSFMTPINSTPNDAVLRYFRAEKENVDLLSIAKSYRLHTCIQQNVCFSWYTTPLTVMQFLMSLFIKTKTCLVVDPR